MEDQEETKAPPRKKKKREKQKTDFIIFGKRGSGLRTLAGMLGKHPQVMINTAGMDGEKDKKIIGEGEILGRVVSYNNADLLFENIPPRIVHLTREPDDNARELLLCQADGEITKKQLSLLAHQISREQRQFRGRLAGNIDTEVFELSYKDLMEFNPWKNEVLLDFLFLRFHRVKVKRVSD